jgi:hypothetical protein
MCNLCVGLGEKGFISAEKSQGSNYRAGDGGYTRWLIKVGTFVVLLIYFYLISILFSFSSLSHLLLFPFSSFFLSSPLPLISFQFLDYFQIKSRPMISHTYSIELKSGERAGQGRISTSACCRKVLLICAIWVLLENYSRVFVSQR